MTKELWQRIEQQAVKWGIFPRGGFMNIREIIKEKGRFEGIHIGRQEGRQEGWQKGHEKGRQENMRQVIANMFRKNVDIPFIAEVTGLSEKEIKKFKNGSK